MNTINVTPSNNVVTGANAAQQATVVTDLSQVQGPMVNIQGGLDIPQQGHSFNNTWTNAKMVVQDPLSVTNDTLVYQAANTRVTCPDDYVLFLPIRFSFQQNTAVGIAKWPTPNTPDANIFCNMITPEKCMLDAITKVTVKLGTNNLDIMSNSTSKNSKTDKGALKVKSLNKHYTMGIDDKEAISVGPPFTVNIDNSASKSLQSLYEKNRHLQNLWNMSISELYRLAIQQYITLGGLNFVAGVFASKTPDILYTDVNWPIPMKYLHELFDNTVWFPIQMQYRIEISLNTNSWVVGSSPLSGFNINAQINPTANNKHQLITLGREAKENYISSMNNSLVMKPATYLLNKITTFDLQSTGAGRFSGQVLTAEQLPRHMYIRLYYAKNQDLNFGLGKLPTATTKDNTCYNIAGNPLAGFVLSKYALNLTNANSIELLEEFPSIQLASPRLPTTSYLEDKYYTQFQEKTNYYEVPYIEQNYGDPCTAVHIALNLDPTYDASLGNTTLMNGQTNGKLDISFQCLDPTFTDWANIICRVVKLTDYQITYDVGSKVSTFEFPVSVGNTNTPIIPQQIPGPQI